ncbi:MAG: hypothetical protein KKA38_07280 [Euryarchaeota archaeon]|nr:hypothetical protein [Euryarchaeota archaeon]MBU4608286.1 hypothetical protein [Euryarchaeota archaeon]MBV1767021.1 hypothetical protein [Methanobacterium sp.]
METTTASVQDSQVDLTKPGEVSYRDKAYSFAKCRGFNAAMKRAVRDHPLKIRNKLRNKWIAKKRVPGERPFAVIKNVFKTAHTLLTAIPRVSVKNMFSGFDFNLFHLNTLKKQGHPATAIIK